MRYISLLALRQLCGLKILSSVKPALTASANALKSSPWKILQTKTPPGRSTRSAMASAASHSAKERAASTPRLPVVDGAMSLSTTSKLRPK